MSEEFKPVRITLSEEAFGKLEEIMKGAKFRSYSSTIEECIRAVYDIMLDIYMVLGVPGKPWIPYDDLEAIEAFKKIANSMRRLTGRTILTKTQEERVRQNHVQKEE